MHLIVKRGLGFLALTSLLAACAATSDKTTTEEHAGATSEALGEMACTQLGVGAPITPSTGAVIATQTNGCKLQAAVISADTAYGITGCPNQFLLNITHVTSTANNPVAVHPHANISETDCPNTLTTLGIYARDDHQNNPWTILGTTTATGVWQNGVCSFDVGAKNQINLPTTTAYTSIMIAASAYTNVYYKGIASQSYRLVSINVNPTCP